MNFQELIGKISDFDKPIEKLTEQTENTIVKSDMDLNAFKKLSGIDESAIEECGGMMGMGGMPPTPPVTMNVSMNASGSGSIRDLLDILTGKMSGDGDAVQGPKGVVIGVDKPEDDGPESLMKKIGVDVDEKFDNEPEEEYKDVQAVIPTGDDLASKGKEAPKVNGGGNPMQEALKSRLSDLYNEIKER